NGEDIDVMIVDFSSSASNSGWTDFEGALAYLAQIVAGGSTNYDNAIAEVMATFGTVPDNDPTQLYFISDGEPSNGGALTSGEITAWQNFLNNNNIIANALGIGSGVDSDDLEDIAYNGVT